IYGLNESSTVTMVIGADVTYPDKRDSLSPSVAAVVASMDCGATKYRALLCPQPPWTEFITDLFTRTKGAQPGGLIRDGVADLEFNKLLDTEVASIYKACEDGKLQLGTLVENDVCHSSIPDFYLCSAKATQGALQGHAKPNRHVVLQNDNDFTEDQLHEITYSLCHVYAGCDTSVSLVTPVYYSRLAATRGRELLEGYMADIDSSTSVTVEQARVLLDLPPKIANTMFFL
ncbi:protein argonaute 5, partial [Tanacetum coccineum]